MEESLTPQQIELIGRIEDALSRAGQSKRAIAQKLEIQPQSITGWTRTGSISKKNLVGLAALAGVQPSDILDGPMPPPTAAVVPAYSVRAVYDGEATDDDVLIEEVEVELSAGGGRLVPEYRSTKRQLAFSADWLRRKRLKASDLKVMPVHGDSMLPRLADGDTVLVNLADRRVVDGRIYALVLGRASKIKTLRWRSDGALIIHSENPDKAMFPDEVIEPNEAAEVYIIGRAVQRAGDL